MTDSLKYDDKENADILQEHFSIIFTCESEGHIPVFSSKINYSVVQISEDVVKKHLLKVVNI